jgi:hypothetical protein
MRANTATVALLLALAPSAGAETTAGGPQRQTLAAWERYVAATEARINAELETQGHFLASDFTADRDHARARLLSGEIHLGEMSTPDESGAILTIPGGTIAHWRGAVLLRHATLDSLLGRLQHPDEHGPLPDDVMSMRVLKRGPDWLTLAMRVTRTKIVTVTYDTEHLATYRRLGPSRAFSKSVSTRIAEVAGGGTATERVRAEGLDRGFLWRMNSYWRYEQVPGGVIVELESLTLSRSIPMGLGMVLGPMIDRIARESVTRTLASVRRLYAVPDSGRAANPE